MLGENYTDGASSLYDSLDVRKTLQEMLRRTTSLGHTVAD